MDAKFKVGGLEALDLLIALIFGATMNLFVGGTFLEIPLVIGAPIVIIIGLYFSKKDKPDNYIAHLVQFYLEKGFFEAASKPNNIIKQRVKIYE